MVPVHRATAKEPKRSPSRGHLFLLRPICLFSLSQNEKSNITESKRQNRTSQIMNTLYNIRFEYYSNKNKCINIQYIHILYSVYNSFHLATVLLNTGSLYLRIKTRLLSKHGCRRGDQRKGPFPNVFSTKVCIAFYYIFRRPIQVTFPPVKYRIQIGLHSLLV